MSAEESSWRTPNFRQSVVAKIEEAIRSSGMPTSKNSMEMENHVFQKAKTKEEYLGFVARLILHVREMNSKKNPALGGPAGGGGQNMQNPIDALQTLARQGSGNQMMGLVPPQGPASVTATNYGTDFEPDLTNISLEDCPNLHTSSSKQQVVLTAETPSSKPTASKTSVFDNKRTSKKIVSHATKFHRAKMAFLKAEHLKRMEVLEEEKNFWMVMNRNAGNYKSSSFRSLDVLPPQPSSEKVTCELLRGVLE